MIHLFKQNRLLKYLYFCFSPLYYLFGLFRIIGLIPQKYIIYGAAGGSQFIDNSKYSFLLNKNDHNCIWITHSSSLAKELKLKGYRAFLSYSIKGKFFQTFAKIAIVSHGTFDLIPILLCRVPVLQYWHGCPIKKIGADVYNHSSKKIGEKIWEWIYKLIPHLNNYYSDYFVDNSINMNYSKTFKSFVPSYIQLPYPRLVTLYSDLSNEIDNVDTTIDELISQKSKGKYIIVYMPTYREGINEQRDCENQLIILSKLFSNDDRFVFVYKAHFIISDTTDIINENFIKYDNPDPYPLLSISSALISDYSSVIFDYMPTRKPLSIFAYDIDIYKNNPGYYYDIEKLFSSYITREPLEVYNMLSQQLIDENRKSDEQVNIFNNLFLPTYNKEGPYDIQEIKRLCGIKK